MDVHNDHADASCLATFPLLAFASLWAEVPARRPYMAAAGALTTATAHNGLAARWHSPLEEFKKLALTLSYTTSRW